jgi:hypothetical protein
LKEFSNPIDRFSNFRKLKNIPEMERAKLVWSAPFFYDFPKRRGYESNITVIIGRGVESRDDRNAPGHL